MAWNYFRRFFLLLKIVKLPVDGCDGHLVNYVVDEGKVISSCEDGLGLAEKVVVHVLMVCMFLRVVFKVIVWKWLDGGVKNVLHLRTRTIEMSLI